MAVPDLPVWVIDVRVSTWSLESPMSPPSRYCWPKAQESTGVWDAAAASQEKVLTPVSRLRVKKVGEVEWHSLESLAQRASKGTSGQFCAVSLVRLVQSAAVQRSAYEKVTFASASSVNSAPLRSPYLISLRYPPRV